MSDSKTVQTIELSSQRYVVLPEADYLTLQSRNNTLPDAAAHETPTPFAKITPLRVGGTPASEVMLRDRQ